MGADARFRAFLAAIVSATWISVASLAFAVVADILKEIARPAALVLVVALAGSAAGLMVCRSRVRGKGILGGLISVGICICAGLVVLLLALSAFIIP